MFLPEWLLTVQQQAAQPASPTLILSKPVFTWGQNYNGSLGLGDTIVRSSPVQIGTSSWIMVSAGYSTSVGVLSTGALFTWGSPAAGALGNGTTAGDRSSPIAIGSSSWNYVEAAWGTNFAIRTDGGLFVWGSASLGKHGLNDNTNRNSPVQIGTSSWIQVSSKNLNVAAITNDNRLFVWGVGTYLGLGSTSIINRSSPVQLTTNAISLFTQVSVGESGTLAIGNDGIGWQWGGVGPNSNLIPSPPGGGAYATPFKLQNLNTQRPTVLSTFQSETDESTYLSLAGKTGFSWRDAVVNANGGMGLRSDNKIFTWGFNTDGLMGMGTSLGGDQVYAPQPLVPQSTFNFIAAGGDQGLRPRFFAIGTDGILYSWGNNFAGSLGVGDTIRRIVPTAVNIASSFVFVAGGPFSTAAISTTGGLFTWGQQTNGALGNGATAAGNVLNPTQIGSSSWFMVKVGHNYMNGITGTYKLFSWGLGSGGQIGDGTANTRSVPTAVGTSSWIFVSAGSSFALAIRSDSTLWSWGINEVGQLGNGDTITRSSPVQISSPANWKWVDACNRSTAGPLFQTALRAYGIASDNTLYAWGFLTSGTGLSISGSRSTPVQISASQYSNVNSGLSYNVAVRTNGVQYYWGSTDPGNSSGGAPLYVANQNIAYSTLQHVQSNWESWRMVSAGASHGAAIRSDYKLFVWGRDDWGQLGTGSSGTVYSYPVQIGSSSWTQVSVGHNSTYAIDTRGRFFAWGLGSGGELGNNSIFSVSSPVQLGSSSFTMVSANRSYVMALRV